MFADRVRLRYQLCPHRSISVNTVEQWGTSHTYTFRDWCEFCGPLTHTDHRPAYAG